jgi:hypothetical protein
MAADPDPADLEHLERLVAWVFAASREQRPQRVAAARAELARWGAIRQRVIFARAVPVPEGIGEDLRRQLGSPLTGSAPRIRPADRFGQGPKGSRA